MRAAAERVISTTDLRTATSLKPRLSLQTFAFKVRKWHTLHAFIYLLLVCEVFECVLHSRRGAACIALLLHHVLKKLFLHKLMHMHSM